MPLPARSARPAQILAPGDGLVDVIVRRHPLRGERSFLKLPAGLSIAELVEEAWPERSGKPAVAYLADQVVPSELWARVRPKPGATLILQPLLQGKGILRSIAMIAVAIIALVVAPYLAGALFAGASAAFIAGATAAIGGAITIGGSLLVNALFPIKTKPPSANNALAPSEEQARLMSISGAQNQPRPFGTIPVVLGKHRISPPFAAKPFTELVGADQYLRLLFCVGAGPLAISEAKIGETPLGEFAGVEIEIRNGYAEDTPPSLFAGQVEQLDLAIVLKANVQNSRYTDPDTDEISIEITAPQGIFYLDTATGERKALGVHTRVFYRHVEAGTGYQQVDGEIIFDRELAQARRGISFPVTRGTYEVMLARLTPDYDEDIYADEVVWTMLRSIRKNLPVVAPYPVALIALRIKASEQLSSIVDTFNVVAESLGTTYNGSGYSFAPSRNPADLFRLALQAAANALPVANDLIDYEALQSWWGYCNREGFTYDAVVEEPTSVYERIALICAAGRAVPTFKDGKWSVVWEQFDTPIVQHFTPRNSSGFTGTRVYQRTPHAFRIKFINAAKGWAADERIVYDDGYDPTNATLFEALDVDGVTDADLAWKFGRYHIAQARLRPERYSILVDWENLRCTRGDRVVLAHDVAKIGLYQGRVKAAAGNLVTLDERIILEAGNSYRIRFRLADGSSLLRDVVAIEGEANTVTLSGAGSLPAVGDLFMLGETERETIVCRVFEIAHQDDLKARLTLVDDAPALQYAHSGAIPAFDSKISEPADPFRLPPRNLSAKEMIKQAGSGATTVVVRLAWQSPRLGQVRGFEAQWRDEQAAGAGTSGWTGSQTVLAPQQWVDIDNFLLGNYGFRVRTLFEDGRVSNWSVLPASAITGDLLRNPLPNIRRLRTTFRDGIRFLDWDEVKDWRGGVRYEIRKGPTWEGALLVETVAHPPIATLGNDTYWVAAVASPVTGLTVYSAQPQAVTITGATLVGNVVAEFDEKASGWTGTTYGTVAVAGDDLRTGGAGDILEIPDFLAEPSILDYGGGGSGAYEIPGTHYIDAGRVAACAVSIDLTATAIWSDQNILTDPDFLGNQDIFTSEAARKVEVFAEICLGYSDPSDIYSASDVYESPDVYSQNIDWGPWQRFTPGAYTARHFKFRVIMTTLDPRAIAIVQHFAYRVDVPDRIDHRLGLDVPVGGLAIVHRPDGASEDVPFNGGPNGLAVPYVNVTILDGGDGVPEFTAQTKAGCTLKIKSGGVAVARKVNLDIQGF